MKNSIALAACLSLGLVAQAEKPQWGTPDTIAHYPIGPGAVYTHIEFTQKPIQLFQVTLDLNDEYNAVEVYPSNGKTPDATRETTSSQCRSNSYEGHRAFFGVNHDLFHYSGQTTAAGINVRNGEIISHYGDYGRSVLSINKDKVAEVFPPCYEAKVICPDQTEIKIDNVNESAYGIQSYRNCVLFNTYSSLTLTTEGLYAKLEPQGEWIINGEPTPCRVVSIGHTPIQPDGKSHILFMRNDAATQFESRVQVGDVVQIDQRFVNTTFPNSGLSVPPAQQVLQAFHGWPSVILNGELHDNEYNDFVTPGREFQDYPCTLVGITKDGKKLFIITADKGSMVEDAYYLVEQGAWNVVNFDGGGSATMVVYDQVVNSPTDGKERAVMDSFQGISLAPDDPVFSFLSFSKPSIKTHPLGVTPLRLLAHNRYGIVIDDDCREVEFSCEPEELGYVNSRGEFCAGPVAMSGTITARRGDSTCKMRVTMSGTTGEPRLCIDSLYIDDIREYPIELEAEASGETYRVNPEILTWSVTGDDCCQVVEGAVKGVKSGRAMLRGSYEGTTVEFPVVVEIGAGEMVHEDFADASSLPVTASSAVTQMRFDSSILPAGWSDGNTLVFDLNTGRAPNIVIDHSMRFFGLPDSVSMQIKNWDSIISSISCEFTCPTGSWIHTLTPEADSDSVYVVPLADRAVTDFPVTLDNLKIYLSTQQKGTDRKISFRDFKAYYPHEATDGIVAPVREPGLTVFKSSPESLMIEGLATYEGSASVTLSDMNGRRLVMLETSVSPSGTCEVLLPTTLSRGVYLVGVQTETGFRVAKLVW